MKIQEMMLQRIEEISIEHEDFRVAWCAAREKMSELDEERSKIRRCMHIIGKEDQTLRSIEDKIFGSPHVQDALADIQEIEEIREELNKKKCTITFPSVEGAAGYGVYKERKIHIPRHSQTTDKAHHVRECIVDRLMEMDVKVNGCDIGMLTHHLCRLGDRFPASTIHSHMYFLIKHGIVEKRDGLWFLKERV